MVLVISALCQGNFRPELSFQEMGKPLLSALANLRNFNTWFCHVVTNDNNESLFLDLRPHPMDDAFILRTALFYQPCTCSMHLWDGIHKN